MRNKNEKYETPLIIHTSWRRQRLPPQRRGSGLGWAVPCTGTIGAALGRGPRHSEARRRRGRWGCSGATACKALAWWARRRGEAEP
jgi:hypothetical protein